MAPPARRRRRRRQQGRSPHDPAPVAGGEASLPPADLAARRDGLRAGRCSRASSTGRWSRRTSGGQHRGRRTFATTVDGRVRRAATRAAAQSLIVWAINEGRQCARMVDRFLVGRRPEPALVGGGDADEGPEGPPAVDAEEQLPAGTLGSSRCPAGARRASLGSSPVNRTAVPVSDDQRPADRARAIAARRGIRPDRYIR